MFIGNFSLSKEREVYALKNYAKFYNELVEDAGIERLDVFAGYALPGDTGFEFAFEQQLSNKINFTLSRGNSTDTPVLQFIWNNLLLIARLTQFCFKKGNYFIFLPSPLGVWSVLILSVFRRATKLGVYIGGHYGREQTVEKRSGSVKKAIKRMAAIAVDKLVIYAIRKSDFVITSSYEYHHLFNDTGKVFLTPPLLNVQEVDLHVAPAGSDKKYITFCGELRHAKGVVDLLNAFIQLVKTGRFSEYRLKIIGSGQALQELKVLAEQNGISDRVVFCGQIKDKSRLKEELLDSVIFVLPSYSEGFPRVAYESFTLGVPTILTPVGGIAFLVKDGEHCLLSEPGNVSDLANKMSLLLGDEDLRLSLAIKARQLMIDQIFPRIRKHGSLSRMIVSMMDQLPALHLPQASGCAEYKTDQEITL